jgi:hypothetical protein
MLRTLLTPHTDNINIQIPKEYIGKTIELIAFSIDSDVNKKEKKMVIKKPSSLRGKLSKHQAEELQKYSKEIRNEWSNRI